MSEQRQQIKSRKRELLRLRGELRSASEKAEMVEHKKSKKWVQQEIFRLKQELRAARRRLEANFEPHNRRLYEYLGVDFGW
jgi:hypothetical protein